MSKEIEERIKLEFTNYELTLLTLAIEDAREGLAESGYFGGECFNGEGIYGDLKALRNKVDIVGLPFEDLLKERGLLKDESSCWITKEDLEERED